MNKNMKRSASLLDDDDDSYDTSDDDDYARMTKDELISALQERDDRISQLERESKRAKKTTTMASPTMAATISPEKMQQKVEQLRKLAYKGIKSQIKWQASCKNGTARFSNTGICDEATFRGFFQLQGKDKTKGGKVDVEKFQDEIQKNDICVSIRYGSLTLNRDVNVTYNKATCEIKINGGYGC